MDRAKLELEDVFCAAMELASPVERAAYLDQACGDDLDARRRVERLLAAHSQAGNFLGAGPAVVAATTDLPAQATGTMIGPYKLLQQIGEGGMGVVWMAQQTQPVHRKVALKVIKPGMDSRQVIARFEAERQALAMMDHVNIARVFDGGTTENGRPYFVMELVHGVPITRYCDDNHLTPRQRLELFVPVCQAIQHAHQKGIIHRDVKPSNVLVTLYDGKPVPKVIDFGVAKATEQKLTERTLFTQYGTLVGTLEYMSPEQAEMSALGVDTRSDIYSLGVLLYELLTGNTPLSHKTMQEAAHAEILRMIKEEEPPRPSTRLSDSGEALASISANRHTEPGKLTKLVRGELDWIVMKTLEKDRNRRYETASAFAADVQRYLNDETVQACPPSAWYRFRKFARRNKRALATVAVVAVAVLIAAMTLGWSVRDRAAREQQIALETSRRLAVTEEGIRQALERGSKSRADLSAILKRPGGVQQLLNQPARWELLIKTAQGELAQARRLAVGAEGSLDAAWTEAMDQLDQQLTRDQADYDLALRLEKIRLEASMSVNGKLNTAYAVREYPLAFAEAGLAVEPGREQETAALVGQSAIKHQLLAALDDWAWTTGRRQEELCRRLLAVARLADPDPWRDQVRDVAVWKKREAFVPLADQAQKDPERFRQLSPQMLYLIGTVVPDQKVAETWLRKAQALHPADFWINFGLARKLTDGKGHEQEAIGFYRAALAVRPQSTLVYNNLGVAFSDQKDQTEAIEAYKMALAIDPQDAEAWTNLGTALRDSEDLPGAIKAYEKAVAIDKNLAAAWTNLGAARCEQEQWAEAMVALKKAVAIDPQDADAWNNLGAGLAGQEQWPAAADAFKKALAIDPQHTMAWTNLGVALGKQKQWPAAVDAYKKALAIDPQDADHWINLGTALRDSKDLPGAIEAYKKAIALDPQSARAHNALAWLLATCADAKFRDPSQAVALAKKAVEVAPKNPDYPNTLGVACYRTRDWKGAIAALEKSMELRKGGDSFDWFFLAMAHRQLGEQDKAREFYDRAVQWMDKNQPTNDELRRFRAEAAELLGVKDEKD